MSDLTIYLTGLGIGLSLIIAIGAQNAFVLRQGLRGSHVFPVVLTCALSDAILIVVGVTSFAKNRRMVADGRSGHALWRRCVSGLV